jgi:hypothetical protein
MELTTNLDGKPKCQHHYDLPFSIKSTSDKVEGICRFCDDRKMHQNKYKVPDNRHWAPYEPKQKESIEEWIEAFNRNYNCPE